MAGTLLGKRERRTKSTPRGSQNPNASRVWPT